MRSDITKDIWVDTSKLQKNFRGIMWEQCIGEIIPFQCHEINGNFKILQYNKDKNELKLQYDDKQVNIKPYNLIHGFIKKTIEYNKLHWEYNIGDRICDLHRDITIIDRKIIEEKNSHISKKCYKYKCNKCGYDCGEYYKHGKYYPEYWANEDYLNRNCGCYCCSSTQIVVPGINDIPTTDPWMIPYFQCGNQEAKLYSSNSGQYIYPICPECGKIKKNKMRIQSIHSYHSINCICSDGISYPNKFSYALLEQLPVENWIPEYSPEWAGRYSYDNYFEYDNKKYVMELDGSLGHGKKQFGKTKEQDINGLKRDKIKEQLAEDHNIEVIRIDCCYDCVKDERFEYIKNHLKNSKLNKIIDLQNVNWNQCNTFATSNIIKEICEFLENNKDIPRLKLCDQFKISKWTLTNYLKLGSDYGWCSYNTKILKDKLKRNINIYDINKNYLRSHLGIKDLARNSEIILGVKLYEGGIRKVCNGEWKYYKDYIFEWAD